jgi:hypothetical protein
MNTSAKLSELNARARERIALSPHKNAAVLFKTHRRVHFSSRTKVALCTPNTRQKVDAVPKARLEICTLDSAPCTFFCAPKGVSIYIQMCSNACKKMLGAAAAARRVGFIALDD